MADTPVTRHGGRQLMNRISGAMNATHGSGLGAMMGFMGLPFFSRGSDYLGSYAGHGQMLSPWDNYGMGGFGGRGLGGHGGGGVTPPTTGGEDPGVDDGTDGSDGTLGRGHWSFPQYTQTWAFTPPTPAPYMTPNPFSASRYGNPFSKKNK